MNMNGKAGKNDRIAMLILGCAMVIAFSFVLITAVTQVIGNATEAVIGIVTNFPFDGLM